MLTRLPIEIFKNIGLYLSNEDIATCQRVCRNWYKRWISFAYFNVHTKGKLQFSNFLQHSLQSSFFPARTEFSIGYQIRKLVIENGHIDPIILGELPLLCPYLEVFMYDGVILSEKARKESFQYYQQRKNREELDKIRHNFIHWKNMREIVEFNGITVTHSLLHNLQQLTHIFVQFNNSNDRTNSKSFFMDSLINAPSLTCLSMERIYLSVKELEKIHANCPKLHSFKLINTVFLPITDDCLLQSVAPARHLKCLKVVDGGFCDDVSTWLDYISRKYIYATKLDIGSCSYSSPLPMENGSTSVDDKIQYVYQDHLLKIAREFTKLQSLTLLSFALGNQFFNILDRKGTALSELTIGDGLSSVMLANELRNLIRSKQRHYINTLTILGWPLSTSLQGTFLIMQTLTSCTRLTSIYLSMGRYLQKSATNLANTPNNSNTVDNGTLYLDFILEYCPKLLSLAVRDAKLITTGDDSSSIMSSLNSNTSSFSLQSFTLENVLFQNNSVFDIISQKCPSLTHLSLISTVPCPEQTYARHLSIYLPNHRLKSLVLDRIRVSRKCSIRLGTSRFKVTSKQKTIWYDLVKYECSASQFSFRNNRVTSDAAMILSEKMRARKVRVTHDVEYTLEEYNLDQSVYVAVCCAEVGSVYLSGLQVV